MFDTVCWSHFACFSRDTTNDLTSPLSSLPCLCMHDFFKALKTRMTVPVSSETYFLLRLLRRLHVSGHYAWLCLGMGTREQCLKSLHIYTPDPQREQTAHSWSTEPKSWISHISISSACLRRMMSSPSHGRRVPLQRLFVVRQWTIKKASDCWDLSREVQCDLTNERSSSGLERFCCGKRPWMGFSLHDVPL